MYYTIKSYIRHNLINYEHVCAALSTSNNYDVGCDHVFYFGRNAIPKNVFQTRRLL